MKTVFLILSILSVIALGEDPSSVNLSLMKAKPFDPNSTPHPTSTETDIIKLNKLKKWKKWQEEKKHACGGARRLRRGRRLQSLAEFAVTTAMMATLATTAAPKFSGVGEGAKERKTLSSIDKIMKAANTFFNEKVTTEGRGRFPGQTTYSDPVPSGAGYQNMCEAMVDLDTYTKHDFEWPGAHNWVSVFGTQNPDAQASAGNYVNTSEDDDGDGSFTVSVGAEEFLNEFGGKAIKSPFHNGHYIYTVIPGGGAGEASYTPIIIVADLENSGVFWKKLHP